MGQFKFDLEAFLPYVLAVVSTDVSHAFAKHYSASHGLSRAEWRIICHLSQLDEDASISVRDLEARVHLEKSKVSRAVSKLEKRGLLHKNPHPKDARLLEIQLTVAGQEMFSELVPMAHAFQRSLTEGLSIEEADQFSAILQKLQNRLSHL